MGLVIAKVGGSLYDLPDLADRLRAWVKTVGRPVSLFPGGGDGADVIRRLDRRHGIGEDAAHWLWDPLESTCRHASLSIL